MTEPDRYRDEVDHTTGGRGRGEGLPRWVKLSLIIGAIVVLAAVAIMLIGVGGHTPGPPPGGH